MIFLNENKEYYVLYDKEEESWCKDTIYEGLDEVLEQFNDYGNLDEIGEYDDYVLQNMSISDCLNHWCWAELHKWNGYNFTKIDPPNYKYSKKETK